MVGWVEGHHAQHGREPHQLRFDHFLVGLAALDPPYRYVLMPWFAAGEGDVLPFRQPMFYRFPLGVVQGQAAETDAIEGVDDEVGSGRQLLAATLAGDAVGRQQGKLPRRLASGADQSFAGQEEFEAAIELDAGPRRRAGPPLPPAKRRQSPRPRRPRPRPSQPASAAASSSGRPTCSSQPPMPFQRDRFRRLPTAWNLARHHSALHRFRVVSRVAATSGWKTASR